MPPGSTSMSSTKNVTWINDVIAKTLGILFLKTMDFEIFELWLGNL